MKDAARRARLEATVYGGRGLGGLALKQATRRAASFITEDYVKSITTNPSNTDGTTPAAALQ